MVATIARVLTLAAAMVCGAAQAQPLDKVSFATNWVAQAEHGGFYQALVDGTYKKHGLDVTIMPGGPNVNNYEIQVWALKVAKLAVGNMDLNTIYTTLLPSQKLDSARIKMQF